MAGLANLLGGVYKRALNNIPDGGSVLAAKSFLLNRLPARFIAQHHYKQRFQKLLDLLNPQTLNEKIAWRKVYQRDPRFPGFVDKIAVKAKIGQLVGAQYLIETLWSGADPNKIPFETLVPPYVIKVNHGTGGVIFVKRAADLDIPTIRDTLRWHLRSCHARATQEWAYTQVEPKVLIERMVEAHGAIPDDYKFFVYHGRVHFVQVDKARFAGHRRDLYDRDLNRIEGSYHRHPALSEPVKRPQRWEEMLEVAENIGEQFDFVRVDLYDTPRGVLFGEVTFYPGAGFEQFSPESLDAEFGRPWKIPSVR
jgi:hypothetical protein